MRLTYAMVLAAIAEDAQFGNASSFTDIRDNLRLQSRGEIDPPANKIVQIVRKLAKKKLITMIGRDVEWTPAGADWLYKDEVRRGLAARRRGPDVPDPNKYVWDVMGEKEEGTITELEKGLEDAMQDRVGDLIGERIGILWRHHGNEMVPFYASWTITIKLERHD